MIRVISTGVTGELECGLNAEIAVRLHEEWREILRTNLAWVAATDVEVIPSGDRDTERFERQIVAAARDRIARRMPS